MAELSIVKPRSHSPPRLATYSLRHIVRRETMQRKECRQFATWSRPTRPTVSLHTPAICTAGLKTLLAFKGRKEVSYGPLPWDLAKRQQLRESRQTREGTLAVPPNSLTGLSAAVMTIGRCIGLLLFAALMAAIGFGGGHWYYTTRTTDPQPPDSEDYAQLGRQTVIEAQGRLEPAEGTIAVSALPGEEIVKINVHVGQEVTAGKELAVLGSAEIREAEYELALAQKNKAQAQLESELALSKRRIEAAELAAQLAAAREKELPPEDLKKVLERRKELAQTQLTKLEQLHSNPVTRDAITVAELEQQRVLIRQLEAEILQATQKKEAATTAQDLAEQAANLDVAIAKLGEEALVKSDPANVLDWTAKLAERTRDATKVLAPSDGRVLEIYAREGERAANTPILLMADLTQMICVAEVHESRLQDIETTERDGMLVPAKPYPVTIQSVALAKPLQGKIIEVGRLIGAPKLRDPNPLARSDRRTAEVKIQLAEDSQEAARKYVHLQVNVTIELEPQSD